MDFLKLDEDFDQFNLADSDKVVLVPGLPRGNLLQLLGQREMGLNTVRSRGLAGSLNKRRAAGLGALLGPFGVDGAGLSGALAEDNLIKKEAFTVTNCELKGHPDPMLALGKNQSFLFGYSLTSSTSR